MLILTRHASEAITIGDEVTVVVLEIKGRSVRLGVRAPKEVTVYREEIYERIKLENAERDDR
jgi:carbon storage regulator